MWQRRSLIGTCLLIVLEIGVSPASAQRAKRSAAWTPEAASLKGLGTVTDLDKYTIRVPKGYGLVRPNNLPAGVTIWGWAGAERPTDRRDP